MFLQFIILYSNFLNHAFTEIKRGSAFNEKAELLELITDETVFTTHKLLFRIMKSQSTIYIIG